MRSCSGCFILFLSACMFAGGCKQSSATPTLLESKAQPYVADIPVPAEFERHERTSSYTFTPGSRSVKDFYRGDASLQAVYNFYKHHMPLNGWELQDESFNNVVHLITYRKGNEVCEIRIERIPLGAFRGSVTQVRALVTRDAP